DRSLKIMTGACRCPLVSPMDRSFGYFCRPAHRSETRTKERSEAQLTASFALFLRGCGLLTNSNQEVTRLYAKVISAAADQLGLTLQQFEARSIDEMEPALDAMVKAGYDSGAGWNAFPGAPHYSEAGARARLANERHLKRNLRGRRVVVLCARSDRDIPALSYLCRQNSQGRKAH